ncbi:protein hairy [Penaeus vannamei]|uniref:protein hairy n=1 Tax=Penaeus vannamei TaxID=6689 RepID=UPI00387F9B84
MTSSPPPLPASCARTMKGQQQPVESGRQPRTHVSAAQRPSRFAHFEHETDHTGDISSEATTASQLYHHLSQDADQLCPEDDFLDRFEEEEPLTDDMTAESTLLAHRRAASPADSASTRKSNKPLMEKKRRQRINRCLNDLKTLVLEALKKDPSRYSKLEKADILEMTVRHVQALHRHESAGVRGRMAGGDEMSKYRAGFAQCAAEVSRYLSGMDGLPHDLHANVLSHLNAIASSVTSNVNANATCVQNSVNVAANPPPIIFVLNAAPAAAGACVQPQVAPVATQPVAFQDSAGNSLGAQPHVTLVTTAKPQQALPQLQPQPQQGGLQILPTRLSNGDLALVLPAAMPAARAPEDRRQPSAALQASSPVLTAILTSGRGQAAPAAVVVQPPALSAGSDDSALGAESHDASDSDMSSGVSTPLSSVSSAGSPLPLEEGGRASPRRPGTSRASPTIRPHVWSSNHFREELGAPAGPPRAAPRRQPVLAPKPTYAPRPAPADAPCDAPKPRKDSSPPRAPPPPQSMWRPWH